MTASRESIPAVSSDGHPGAIARVVDVVVDPRAAFRASAERPAWLGAIAIVVLLRLASAIVFYQPQTTPTKVMLSALLQIATVMPAVVATAGVLWVAARIWTVRVRWRVALSVGAHVYVAYTLATVVWASVAGALLPTTVDVDLRQPPFTSLQSWAGPTASSLEQRLLGELDVRLAYAGALVALGVRVVDPGAPRARIAAVLATCWIVRLMLVVSTGG